MNRLEYYRRIQLPCLLVLWELEDRGMRLDAGAVERHRERLEGKEQDLFFQINHIPLVEEELARQRGFLGAELEGLERAKARELAELNAARFQFDAAVAELRAAKARGEKPGTIKSLGKAPPLARKSTFTEAIADLRKRIAGLETFNPNSNQQKAQLLYRWLGMPAQGNGEGGETVDERAMTRLLRKITDPAKRELIKEIGSYVETKKLLSTYVKKCFDGDGRVLGRMYTQYGLHRTATGRIASGSDTDEKAGEAGMNMQNQPKEIRDIFIPDEGLVFIQYDWKQVEEILTLLFAGDWAGIRAILGGEDGHCRFAEALFGIPYGQLLENHRAASRDTAIEEKRDRAKKARHGINYGMGWDKLADEMGITAAEAKEIIATDKRLRPLVYEWKERVYADARRRNYLETPFGYRRYFWAKVPTEEAAFLPSATGADMLKARLPQMNRLVLAHGGVMYTTTHDSILLGLPFDRMDVFRPLGKALMEKEFKVLKMSFPCDDKTGVNWKAVS